jgi:hypothetical protein
MRPTGRTIQMPELRSVMVLVATAGFVLSRACDTRQEVPASRSVDGCYFSGRTAVLRLANGQFRSADGAVQGRYERGRGEAGTYVVFQPGIRLLTAGGRRRIASLQDMKRGHVLVIRERGSVYLRMATEPLGERLLELRACA